ncbi:hypothetical protein MUP95_00750, partial [bacterium]|nr:hypothetical protein [bacterium]
MKNKILALSLSIFSLLIDIVYSVGDWKTYTSMYQITAMCIHSNLIWCGSTGGFLAFDPLSKTFSGWNNTEGLVSNQVTAIACGHQDGIWIGFENGLIQFYDPVTLSWTLIDDYRDYRIECFAYIGDTLFVGLDIGVSLYLISRHEVKETYRHLGEQFQVEVAANEILLVKKQIWVATDEGIAYAQLNNVNLLDPANWTNVTVDNGLPDKGVNALEFWENKIVAGTEKGVAAREIEGNSWTILDSGILDISVLDLTYFNGHLSALTSEGIYAWNGQRWNSYGSTITSGVKMVDGQSGLWIGTDQGLCTFSANANIWEFSRPNTPGDNRFSDIAVDAKGHLLCCTAQPYGKGFSIYDGTEWTIYNRSNLSSLRSDDVVSVTVDHTDNRWFGTWGGGLLQMQPDGTFQFYNAENGYLAGIMNYPNFAVVSDLTVDSSGTLWLLNYYALTNEPVVSVTPDLIWTHYGIQDGIQSTLLTNIIVDSDNRKWIGSGPPTSQGIFILDDNNTPYDKRDDPPVERLTTNNGLASNEITALAAGKDGSIWIGTSKGLHVYFEGTINRRYGPPSDNITALVVDGMNNLWVGTTEGLSFFSNDTYSWTYYTVDNSSLVSNDI